MTELFEVEPTEVSGDRWGLVVAIAGGVSLIAAFCFPPAGVVAFMGTTMLAIRRFRQMPVTVIVVAAAALLTALATPASFLSGPATGTSGQHGASLVPSPKPSR
ncbi:MAG: hypothetical protein FWE35_09515 [Streptosporangiales bacterium]|nr:hypothetical protein [Streptosporangiales bacterium]